MADRHFNPNAIAKKNGVPVPVLPRAPDYGHQFWATLEPTQAKKLELEAMAQEAKLLGHEPPVAHLTDADMDFVVYHQPFRLDPTGIMNVQGQPQMRKVMIQGPEFFRMSLAELNARVNQTVNGGPAEAKG